uniref:NADH-ubiquinone oxidoreductase chain 4 n=1 Tax=Pseudacysta perseae TaxID=1041453 RepID=A0A089QM38_PSEPZ|nr:NADH dehydrogenase subunit 4 [Pseudacysta perseae]AIR11949.1 NADH dehydrogenase subunit 4 [Pseudacysta perseae]
MMKLVMMIVFMVFFLININYYIFMLSLMMTFMLLIFMSLFNYSTMLSYTLGLDTISWSLIMLTTWIVFLMMLSSFSLFYSLKSKEFFFMNFFLLIFLFLSFASLSFFMYYIFFEASLIPTLFLIFGWGYQPERLAAGFYLIFYTIFASLPLLLSIFYILSVNKISFFWLIDMDFNLYMFYGLVTAFLVKLPVVMMHFWLPKAHVEAPISGSMILAGVLLKLGGYGLIRVSLIISDYMYEYGMYFVSLSLFGGVMCGLICCVQLDMKVLVAYSSVCHMSLCIMGIFSLLSWGIWGSFILMLAHGLCSSCLFCLVNLLYERSQSRNLLLNKGYIIFMPSLCLFWFICSANNMCSPLSMNLFGELMLIINMLGWSSLTSFYLMILSFLSCVYSMYLFSYVNHGFTSNFNNMFFGCNVREYLLVFFHLFPLNIVSLKFMVFMI